MHGCGCSEKASCAPSKLRRWTVVGRRGPHSYAAVVAALPTSPFLPACCACNLPSAMQMVSRPHSWLKLP